MSRSQPIYLNFSGKHVEYPNEEQLRRYMLDCVNEFHSLTEMPITTISKNAVKDPAFIKRIQEGRDFRVTTFGSIMSWLDEHWPAD